MKLIVGLGNIGAHFDGTRHNTGFMVVDALGAAWQASWQQKDKFKAQVAETLVGDQKVLLLKPTNYYNLSGEAVRAVKDFYKIDNSDILAAHDDIDLPFGTIRVRIGGSDAGNNGIKSLTQHIGADFARVRIGIANEHREATDAADFVLAQFSHDEREKLSELIHEAREFVDSFIANPTEFAHTSIQI